MTIGAQDLELIKKEVAGIRDFYQSRMDSEIPPLKSEVDRIATQLARIQEMWRDGEKRAILAKYSGADRARVPYDKYMGRDPLDLACVRSLLTAQMRDPAGLNPRMLEEWQRRNEGDPASTRFESEDAASLERLRALGYLE